MHRSRNPWKNISVSNVASLSKRKVEAESILRKYNLKSCCNGQSADQAIRQNRGKLPDMKGDIMQAAAYLLPHGQTKLWSNRWVGGLIASTASTSYIYCIYFLLNCNVKDEKRWWESPQVVEFGGKNHGYNSIFRL